MDSDYTSKPDINALEQQAEAVAYSAHPDEEEVSLDDAQLEEHFVTFFRDATNYLLGRYGDDSAVQRLRVVFNNTLYAVAVIVPPYSQQVSNYHDLRAGGTLDTPAEHSAYPDSWPEHNHIVTIQNDIYDDRSVTDVILAELYASNLLTKSAQFITATQPRRDSSFDMVDPTPNGSTATVEVTEDFITIDTTPADIGALRHACFMPLIVGRADKIAEHLVATRAYAYLQASESPTSHITLHRLHTPTTSSQDGAGILPRYWEQV